MSWLDGITDSMDMFEQTPGDSEGQGRPGVLQARSVRSDMRSQRVRHHFLTEQQQLYVLYQLSVTV